MMSRSAWGEVCIRAGVCTGVTTAIRKLCSFVMGRGADVTHLPKAWPHTHTRTHDTGNIWMFTLLANVSGFPVEKREFEKRNFIKRQPWWYFYAVHKQNLKSTIEHLYGLVARGAITDLTEQKHLYAHLFFFWFCVAKTFHVSSERAKSARWPVQLFPSSPTIKTEAIKAPPQIKPPLFLALLFSAINYTHLACDCWWQLFDGVNKNAVNNRWLRSLFARCPSPERARRRTCRCGAPSSDALCGAAMGFGSITWLIISSRRLVCGLFKCKTNTSVPLIHKRSDPPYIMVISDKLLLLASVPNWFGSGWKGR